MAPRINKGENMPEYYIEANSFAAPFFSDTSYRYVFASSPEDALEQFAKAYEHPCGLYSAAAYSSADAKNKGQKPLSKWLSNHEIAKEEATRDLGGYSYCGEGPGSFSVNDRHIKVENPKAGRICGHGIVDKIRPCQG